MRTETTRESLHKFRASYHNDCNSPSHISNYSNRRFLLGHHYWKGKQNWWPIRAQWHRLCVFHFNKSKGSVADWVKWVEKIFVIWKKKKLKSCAAFFVNSFFHRNTKLQIFPPLYPHLLLETEMPNLVQHMPCTIKRVVFCPGYPIKRQNVTAWKHTPSDPGWGRHMAAVCIWINMHKTFLFHKGTTVTDKHWWRFLHTHLHTFWGQSSVQRYCCQQLLLHAHNKWIAARMSIIEDATAAFLSISQHKLYTIYI